MNQSLQKKKISPAFKNEIFKLKNNNRITPEKCKVNLNDPSKLKCIWSKDMDMEQLTISQYKSSDNLEIFKNFIYTGKNSCECVVC